MTTVISRVYKDGAAAEAVTGSLAEAGFPSATYEVITADKGAGEAIRAARVPEGDVAAYLDVLKGKAAMVVVRAPVVPFGAARKAMALVDAVESLPVEVERQDVHIRETADPALFDSYSILKDHPRWFSPDIQPGSGRKRSLMSEVFYWPLLMSSRTRNSARRGGGFLSQKIIRYPLLSDRRPKPGSVFPGGKRFFYHP